jgi:TetR/AcrR family transcriptional repressor of nem operon
MPYPAGHREAVKKSIIDSARKLFNRHGFENISLHQIMAGAVPDARRILCLL